MNQSNEYGSPTIEDDKYVVEIHRDNVLARTMYEDLNFKCETNESKSKNIWLRYTKMC